MAVFKTVYKSEDGTYLAKLIFDQEDKEKWAECSQAVYNFAKKNFEEDEVVEVEYTKDEEKNKYHVTKIMKKGKKSNSKKYNKSYNKNTGKKNYSGKTYYQESPEKQESIKRQAMLKASVEAVKILQGHLGNVDAIIEAVSECYDAFIKKIS